MGLELRDVSRASVNKKNFTDSLIGDVLTAIVDKQIEISNSQLVEFVENNKDSVLDFTSMLSSLNLLNSSVAHEILTCVAEDVGLSSIDYNCDLSNGTECKHSYALRSYKKDNKIYYRWYIQDIKNKDGKIVFIGFNKNKKYKFDIPYSAYQGKKCISINTDENGFPIKGPYKKYYVGE